LPIYWIWFAELKGISLFAKRQLLETGLLPEELWRMAAGAIAGLPADTQESLRNKDLTKAEKIYRDCMERDIHILSFWDADYPEKLRNIEDPPMVLYYKGQLPDWKAQPVIGVVGTRKASPYGLQAASLLSAHIAVCGGIVVSGAASGIDTAAMESALEMGKPTVGVLGCGVDVVYPAKNKALYSKTEENGCLLSEFTPGSRPYPWNFLQRNRIISGLSDGVLVVEAPEKSGALNTARHAFSQGRDMFAVPGNLGVETCLGSNALLQEGAYAALSGWDVVKHYEPLYPDAVANRPVPVLKPVGASHPKVAEAVSLPKQQRKKKEMTSPNAIDNGGKSTYSVINERPANLNDQENAVLALLSDVPKLPDSVMDACDLSSGTVQSILTRLTIKGLAQYHPDGRISRK